MAPRQGVNVVETRLTPDGKVPPLDLDTDFEHKIVVHVPGDEQPQALTPETRKAEGGLSIPKLGEKFAANGVTGSGGASIHFALPPGRGLTPSLGISYDSSGENGPFGLGWHWSVPFVVRATTRPHIGKNGRGIPTYDDASESDVFIASDAAELVKIGGRSEPSTGHTVHVYRPRIEGGFVRIERWEKGGDSHWRITGRNNTVSVFGETEQARIADPDDPKKVFRWNLERQVDALGNVVLYGYKREDDRPPQHGPPVQTYLKRILDNNRTSFADPHGEPSLERPQDFTFEVVVDYGEHFDKYAEVEPWADREDSFSNYRAGFEIRTQRLCHGVLVFHRFAELQGADTPVLASRTGIGYLHDFVGAVPQLVNWTGFGDNEHLSLPSREFKYTPVRAEPRTRQIRASDLGGLDLSKPLTDAEFVDLHGTGVAGLLTREQGKFLFRERDLADSYPKAEPVEFGASVSEEHAPHKQRFLDLDGDGRPALVEFGPGTGELWERERLTEAWRGGKALPSVPPVAEVDDETGLPRVYLADLDGDGRTDALVAKEKGGPYTWWRFEGEDEGWIEQADTFQHASEDEGPSSVLSDPDLAVFLADMTGDGLADVLCIRPEGVAYWPNLGYGKFGPKIDIDAPDMPDEIDPERVRLLDVNGLGCTDILLIGDSSVTLFLNNNGNSLEPGISVPVGDTKKLKLSSLTRLDGRATGSFAFAEGGEEKPIKIIDFIQNDVRPLLLETDSNNMGLQTRVTYAPSTKFFIKDRGSPTEWKTRLPHCVPVVESIEERDLVAGTRFTSSYRYRHGYYDATEREFRGFGYVEQVDTEGFADAEPTSSSFQTMDEEHFAPPVLTKRWSHTGAEVESGATTELFRDEYDDFDRSAAALDEPTLPPGLGADGRTEAVRALAGLVLRTEVFGVDDSDQQPRPFSVTEHGYAFVRANCKAGEHHHSLHVIEEQSLAYAYERETVPDPRLAQSAVLDVDEYGNVRKSISVAYPRRQAIPEPTVPGAPRPKPTDPTRPPGVRARIVGFMFDEAKNFILPPAREALRQIATLYEQHPGATVLIVGHTDRVGSVDYNNLLSLQRGNAVVQYLRDEVQGWESEYDNFEREKRWGRTEDLHMLEAAGFAGDVVGFQRAHGLEDDGDIGPITRRALITAYMGMDGTTLPPSTNVVVVGAGEHYPEVDSDESEDQPLNRRTEVFFFADGLEPPPPPSDLLGPDSEIYESWRAQAGTVLDVSADDGRLEDPEAPPDPAALPPEDHLDPEHGKSERPEDDPQLRTEVVLTQTRVTNADLADRYIVGAPVETLAFAVEDQRGDPFAPFSVAQLAAMTGTKELAKSKTFYYDDNVSDKAPLGTVGKRGLVHSTLTCAFTPAEVETAFGGDSPRAFEKLEASSYVREDDAFWIPSGHLEFDPDRFFVPVRSVDPFGQVTTSEYDEEAYLVRRVTDPLSNASETEYDYRRLAPTVVRDPNGATTSTVYNPIGLPTRVAENGPSGSGNTLEDPTHTFEYDFDAFEKRGEPTVRRARSKVLHREQGEHRRLSIDYHAGSGAVLQTKLRTEDGNFIASGRAIVNNKGDPVLQFQPAFTADAGFSPGVGKHVATIRYDAIGRPVRTEHRDGTLQRVEFTAWEVTSFDRNDTVLESEWFRKREGLALNEPERRAADQARRHANTPSVARLDTLGRTHATFEHLVSDDGESLVATRSHFDAAGREVEVIDARGNVAEKRIFGLGGALLATRSVDGGVQAQLPTIDGGRLFAMRGGSGFFTTYDELRRPVDDCLESRVDDGEEIQVLKHRVYIDEVSHAAALAEADVGTPLLNHRGRLWRVYDGGGELTIEAYDFRGIPFGVVRHLPSDPRTRPDWASVAVAPTFAIENDLAAPLLDDRRLETNTFYTVDGQVHMVLPPTLVSHNIEYRQEGRPAKLSRFLLEKEDEVTVLSEVGSYDALGRALEVRQGEAVTRYTYDDDTERLASAVTKAGSRTLQSLHYTYDPAGNITEVHDKAQRTITTGGAKVEPITRFRYDSLYRLEEATGREHIGQSEGASPFKKGSLHDALKSASPHDPDAMRSYTQRYTYDQTGNILRMRHITAAKHSPAAWTRSYTYSDHGNQLRAIQRRDHPTPSIFPHDQSGRITTLEHLDDLQWDELDQLRSVQRGTTKVFFQYVDGKRVRKFVEKGDGIVEERLYLGPEEQFTRTRAGKVTEQTVTEFVGTGLLIETKTATKGKVTDLKDATPLFRYRLSNQVRSTSLEFNEEGQVLSYEEHHPFGTAAYRAQTSQLDISPNRYRFTAMERDEETALSYHGARYYAPWLARWLSPDPIGLGGGHNRYAYCRGDPVAYHDTTGHDRKKNTEFIGELVKGVGYGAFGVAAIAAEALDVTPTREEVVETAEQVVGFGNDVAKAQGALSDFIPASHLVGTSERAELAASLLTSSLTAGFEIGSGFAEMPENGAQTIETGKRFRKAEEAAYKFELGAQFTEELAKTTKPLSEIVLLFAPAASNTERRAAKALQGKRPKTTGRRGSPPPPEQTPNVDARPEVAPPDGGGPLAGATDAEIAAAVEAPGTSDVLLRAPAPIAGKHSHSGGQMMVDQVTVMSKSSATGAAGNVRTKIRVHTADPGTGHPTGNSATGNTLSVTQGSGGKRRMLPDGTWVRQSTATDAQWNAAHIPIHRGRR